MSTTLLTIKGPTKESPSFNLVPSKFKLTDPSEEQNFSKLRQELTSPELPEKIRDIYDCATCALTQTQSDLDVALDTFRLVPSKSESLETLLPVAYCSLLLNFLKQKEEILTSSENIHTVPNCENFSIVLNLLNA